MKQPRSWWSISISGYGMFTFFGTREEADAACRDKAAWEGGRGTIRTATSGEIDEEKDNLIWQQQRGYPLAENELEALKS